MTIDFLNDVSEFVGKAWIGSALIESFKEVRMKLKKRKKVILMREEEYFETLNKIEKDFLINDFSDKQYTVHSIKSMTFCFSNS
jgi:hypothetical protein